MNAKPIVKWAGGKTYLVPEILKRLPERVTKFYEPFAGGAAVSIAMMNAGRCRQVVLSDVNLELITTYRVVKESPDSLIDALTLLASTHDEGQYYRVREDVAGWRSDAVKTAARFVYLNKTCYNGLYRVNKSGTFNSPFGHKPNPKICDADNIRALSRLLRRHHAVILNGDFGKATPRLARNDAVYYDPPYVPLNATSFTSYAAGDFDEFAHSRLARAFQRNVNRGAFCLLSNSDTDTNRALYEAHKIETVEVPRRINSKGDGRGKVSEILVTGVRHV